VTNNKLGEFQVETQKGQEYDGWLGRLLTSAPEGGYENLTAALVVACREECEEESAVPA